MTRKKPSDFDQNRRHRHEQAAADVIGRREFLARAARHTVGGLAAATLLVTLSPRYALAAQVQSTDARVTTQYVDYPSPKGHGRVHAYLARPAGTAGKLPGVVVVHENPGLTAFIKDVARRLAIAGFMALVPDEQTSLGGQPGKDNDATGTRRKPNGAKPLEDALAGFEYLKQRPDCTGKVGVVGFSAGIANEMAVRLPDLAAAVSFYGMEPAAGDVPRIQALLLLHYATLDPRIDAGWPIYARALQSNGKRYTAFLYAGVHHGFFNDTSPNYNKRAAERAWRRTITFFKMHLK